jgi:hypothetical protein
MKVGEEAKNRWLAAKNARLDPQPFWGYEDVGAFFLLIVSLGLILRLLARVHFLSRSAIINPSVGLQSAVAVFLGAGLYSVLRLRYRHPVLKPLGLGSASDDPHHHRSYCGTIVCGRDCALPPASQPDHTAHSSRRVASPRSRPRTIA